MRRLLSRGGLAWVAAGVLVYACGGDTRKFVDTDVTGGAGGEGAVDTGGTSSGKGGNGGTAGGGTSGTSGEAGGPAGDGGTTSTGGRGGTAGRGGTSSQGGSGAGGEGGTEEPPEPPPPGRPGTALVSGGMWMQSSSYRLFAITGHSSLPQTATSTNFRLVGGIVGTTQP
jgi:hypothetical protein